MAKRTKIICTLGPAVDSESALKNLLQAGMDVARCNFSHGSHAEHKARMDRLKKVRRELDSPCAIMLDTKGPSIRTGKLEGGKPVLLRAGDNIFLTEEDILGTSRRIHQTFPGLYNYVEPGTIILMDDGLIELAVDRVRGTEIQCTVQNSGMLGECKQLNLPGTNVPLPVMTEQDEADLLFAIEQKVDFVAASFVGCAEDVRTIRSFLISHGGSAIRVVAKIENARAVEHIDEIIAASDAVMVARGDLGVEVPSNQVPLLQKTIIKACNKAYRPVITATQMLESMIHNPRPTRAEISDVANAVYDGASAVMLSGETAAGKYPVAAVKNMAEIAEYTEKHISYIHRFHTTEFEIHSNLDAVSHATCAMAIDVGAKCIVVSSMSGRTARMVSRFRCPADIVGMTTTERAWRKLALSWGVTPVLSEEFNSMDVMFYHALHQAKRVCHLEKGDNVVLTGGQINGHPGNTNTIKVETIK